MAVETKRSSNLWLLCAALAALAVKLWVAEVRDLAALVQTAQDDQLLLDRALSLLSGDWLGPYHERTLIKGPFYSFWIAATFLASVPLLLSQHLLYAVGCGLMAIALGPLFDKRWPSLVLFVILLFNPAGFDTAMARAYRSGVDPALALIAVACAFGLLLRSDKNIRGTIGWSIGLGLALAASWLNREEAIWLLPVLLLSLLGTTVRMFRRVEESRRQQIAVLLLPLLIWQVTLAAVSIKNYTKYGMYGIVEIKSAEFQAGWGALSRAGAGQYRPYVPLPRPVRERLYELSPAFAKLQEALDGPDAPRGTHHGCKWVDVCDDYVGGWTLWTVRAAVARTGHHQSAAMAAGYYQRLADEVNAACDDGRLACAGRRSTLAPVWRWDYTLPLVKTFGRAAATLTRFTEIATIARGQQGSYEQRVPFAILTGETLVEAVERDRPIHLEGWAFSPGRDLSLEIVSPIGSPVESRVNFRRSPAIHAKLGEAAPPEAMRSKFDLWTTCSSKCELRVHADKELLMSTQLDHPPPPLNTDELYFFLRTDWTQAALAEGFASDLAEIKRSAIAAFVRLYGLVVPLFATLAMIAYLAETVAFARTRRLEPSWLLGTSILAGLVPLLGLLAFIELTLFESIKPVYLGPAYPLMLTFSYLLCLQGLARLRSWRSSSVG